MNTKLVMTASAIILGFTGILLTFIPDEIINYLNMETNKTTVFLMQIIGALYFAFAMLNWMKRTRLIGGIYNRPTAIANFTHFLIAGLALVKGLISNTSLSYSIWTVAIFYGIFGISFGTILFSQPKNEIE